MSWLLGLEYGVYRISKHAMSYLPGLVDLSRLLTASLR